MECNRDEAIRAKEIAENKFTSDDFVGAKKFVLKAQALYPGLEGIGQMITTIDVHNASKIMFSGEKDWYAILSVSPSSDDDAIKKQFRKLALQLHPDKNRSVGAEGAFKLVSEAWNVLSDKSKRAVYDQKRNIKVAHQRSAQILRPNSASGTANGFYNFASNVALKTKVGKQKPASVSTDTPSSQTSADPHVAPYASCHSIPVQHDASCRSIPVQHVTPSTCSGQSHVATEPNLRPRSHVVPTEHAAAPLHRAHKPDTFWTVCSLCNMQYEYLRAYLNQNLVCGNCSQPFVASEIPNPSMRSKVAQECKNGNVAKKAHTNRNFNWGPFSRTAGAASASASSVAAAQAATVVHQTYEKVRRAREEAQAAARERRRSSSLKRSSMASENVTVGSGVPAKKVRTLENMDFSANVKVPIGNNPVKANSGSSEVLRCNGIQRSISNPQHSRRNNLSRQFSLLDIRKAVIESGKAVMREKFMKLDGKYTSLDTDERAQKKQKLEESDGEKGICSAQDVGIHEDARANASEGMVNENSESDNDQLTYNVPDPDFYNFDGDRLEEAFKSDQIWATYDDEDGMPRYYAFVQKVLSVKPFKIRMSFLTSKTNSEFGSLNWVASGFPKSCGELRIGRYETIQTVNMFSHKVQWEKGTRGTIRIYPRRGHVWALYRNWSPDWNEHTPDNVIYTYDMVEVLDDYSDQLGISVAPLIKVAGFKTVFQRVLAKDNVKRIPKEEMFRFSHQVPFYRLSGNEADNIPMDCYELDPAATPKELLQVNSESDEGTKGGIEPAD